MKNIGKTWSLGGIPLIVEKDSEDYIKPRMAELGPLDTTYNYLHFSGTEALKRDLTAILFSGYKQHHSTPFGLYGMIGSGYNSLVSDQEVEGNYIITEASIEHLQDIHRNTGKIYRVNMKLIKESLPLPTYKFALVATKLSGLYYSANVIYNNNSDPTWTLLDDTVNINIFDCDRTSPLRLQVAGDSAAKKVYLRYPNGGYSNFTEIFNETKANTAAGKTGTWEDLVLGCFNPYRDEIYALGNWGKYLYFFYTTDWGENWIAVQLYYYSFADLARGVGTVECNHSPTGTYAQGDILYASYRAGAGNYGYIKSSTNAGRNWYTARSSSGNTTMWPTGHPTDQTIMYAGYDDLAPNFRKYTTYNLDTSSNISIKGGPSLNTYKNQL